MIGISQFTRKCHLVRATLEGVAFQTNDILALMRQDNSGIKVDGGMSCNDLLCQILADVSGADIVRPKMIEATALGAAMVAGYHSGLWKIFQDPEPEFESDKETPHMNGHSANGIIESITRRFSMTKRRFSLTRDHKNYEKHFDIFRPKLPDHVRLDRINTWKLAVSRSRKWIRVEKQEQKRVEYRRLSSLPFMMFVLLSFGTHILSQQLDQSFHVF